MSYNASFTVCPPFWVFFDNKIVPPEQIEILITIFAKRLIAYFCSFIKISYNFSLFVFKMAHIFFGFLCNLTLIILNKIMLISQVVFHLYFNLKLLLSTVIWCLNSISRYVPLTSLDTKLGTHLSTWRPRHFSPSNNNKKYKK